MGWFSSTPKVSEEEKEWRESFVRCTGVLEQLAKADTEAERLAARSWWTIGMAGTLPRCRALYDAWRAQAASALPAQLTAQHTEAAVALPGWAAMEKCVVEHGRAVGVEPAQTLAHVERAGPWIRAVDTVNPLREKLQRSFLPGGVAKTQDEMGIDELRVAQVYVYGLAQHLADCRAHATGFARSAGLSNPDMPLKDYDEERWDPRLAEWQRMELCVHAAAQAGSGSVDAAWRAAHKTAA